jgi:hypothetical protein
VISDHAAEEISRYAADKSGRSAKPHHADSNVEARTACGRFKRRTTVGRGDGREIDQRFAAD